MRCPQRRPRACARAADVAAHAVPGDPRLRSFSSAAKGVGVGVGGGPNPDLRH